MCRLLGLIGTPPLPARQALDAFYPLCKDGAVKCTMTPGHLDGWGISGFSRDRAVYFGRRAEPADQDRAAFDEAAAKAGKSQAPVLIAHFRKASAGAREVRNTHPFHYRDWMFAHNGTIFNAASLALQEARPQGDTDSERFFLWLVEKLIPALNPTDELATILKEKRAALEFSSLTFLLSDGKTLWAYRDIGDKNFEKGETAAEREKYYTLHFTTADSSAVVCSEPLRAFPGRWQPIPARTLAVFQTDRAVPQLLQL